MEFKPAVSDDPTTYCEKHLQLSDAFLLFLALFTLQAFESSILQFKPILAL